MTNPIFQYLVEIEKKYSAAHKNPRLTALVHDDDELDRWTLIVSGDGLNGSKESVDEAYDFASSVINGKLPKIIRSIYTLPPDSELITDLTKYIETFIANDPETLKQINRFGIMDGYFIIR